MKRKGSKIAKQIPATEGDKPRSEMAKFKKYLRYCVIAGLAIFNVFVYGLVIIGTLAWLGLWPKPSPELIKLRETRERIENMKEVSKALKEEREKTPLLLISCLYEREHGYISVTGEVKNRSSRSLRSTMVVATFRTADGTFIKVGDSFVDYDPIMPDQASPFKVGVSDNPVIRKCELSFKHYGGKVIPHFDRDKEGFLNLR